MRVGSLFAGIGGFDLGLERAGMEIRWQVENNLWCQRVLAKHWPNVTRYGDIKQVDWHTIEPVDLVCGGFPCQPFSLAGKRKGFDDDRYLWPEVVRCLDAVRPTWFLGENVPGIVNVALDQVCADLEALGYAVQPICVPACAVDAPHQRQRVWILAHAGCAGLPRGGLRSGEAQTREIRDCGAADSREVVAHAQREGSQGLRAECELGKGGEEVKIGRRGDVADTNSEPTGRSAKSWRERGQWEPEPELGGSLNGLPRWLDRFTGGLSYAESRRSIEALRDLWSPHVSEALWRTVGGYGRVEQAAVLFAFVREYENGSDQARLLLACQKAFENGMRSLRREKGTPRASCRSKQSEQSTGEHPDVVQVVPQLSPRNGETPWACASWEDGIPRVASNVPSRVDRLRGLGNAVVPQVVEVLGRMMIEVKHASLV